MKINSKLTLKRITSRGRQPSDTRKYYTFKYNDSDSTPKYKLELSTGFTLEALTNNLIPVFNFGYSLEIKEYNQRKEEYKYIQDADDQNGLSTKKYFSDKESRKIITKFVYNSVKKDIKKYNFPIIVRGPLCAYKQNSKRYLDIDEYLNQDYTKYSVKIQDFNNYIPMEFAIKDEDTDIYWFYVRSDINISIHDIYNLYENN